MVIFNQLIFQKIIFMKCFFYYIIRHGSINYLQCFEPCCNDIWKADGYLNDLKINNNFLAVGALPYCKKCKNVFKYLNNYKKQIARPNILMFNDYYWISDRSDKQENRFNQFYEEAIHSVL